MFSSWRSWTNPSRKSRSGLRNAARRLQVEFLEGRLLPSTFTVVNANDSGAGSLRAAIASVDADSASGIDTIQFAIGSGEQTIALQSALPVIAHAVVIDGTSQPGFTNAPLIVLDGSQAGGSANGLDVEASHCQINGLVIDSFSGAGVWIGSGSNDRLRGNYIGVDAGGTQFGFGNNGGISIQPGVTNVVIGGQSPGDGNLISANSRANVEIQGSQVQLLGNRIGSDASGTQPLPSPRGVWIHGGAEGNVIGGPANG